MEASGIVPHEASFVLYLVSLMMCNTEKFDSQLTGEPPFSTGYAFVYFKAFFFFFLHLCTLIKISMYDDYVCIQWYLLSFIVKWVLWGNSWRIHYFTAIARWNDHFTRYNINNDNILQSWSKKKKDCSLFKYSSDTGVSSRQSSVCGSSSCTRVLLIFRVKRTVW